MYLVSSKSNLCCITGIWRHFISFMNRRAGRGSAEGPFEQSTCWSIRIKTWVTLWETYPSNFEFVGWFALLSPYHSLIFFAADNIKNRHFLRNHGWSLSVRRYQKSAPSLVKSYGMSSIWIAISWTFKILVWRQTILKIKVGCVSRVSRLP